MYEGESLRAMANQMFITVDRNKRLVANFSYEYADELSSREIFYISELEDQTLVLKSAHNNLYVCLDDEELHTSCNASIKEQKPTQFVKLCHSHYKSLIMGVGTCKVFGLRCLANGRSVTVSLRDEDYGVLKVSFKHSTFRS